MLAAGAGTRLRPLTELRPKPLCPIGDRSLLDHALDAVTSAAGAVAVNVHHGAAAITEHVVDWGRRRGRVVHVSVEAERALGTAGAIGHLRGFLDGRHLLVANADTWHRADLRAFADRWDGARVSVLTTTPGPFGPRSDVVASLLPAEMAASLTATPAGLWEVLWAGEVAGGRLETVHSDSTAVDCGTPADYLRANMAWVDAFGASGAGGSVVGEGAEVRGSLSRCVVWPGSTVERGERLVDAIRAEHLTVLVR